MSIAQTVTTDPSFALADQPLTITVDVTGTSSLEDETNVWIWAWLPELEPDFDAPTNVNPATSAQDLAKFTSTGQANEYSITFTPTTFFNKPADEITRIGFLVKAVTFDDGKTIDLFIDINKGDIAVKFTRPDAPFLFADPSGTISVTADASIPADLTLFVDGESVQSVSEASQLTFDFVAASSGSVPVRIEADNGGSMVSDEFTYVVRANPTGTRPAGIIQGINYDADATKATFCLFAPGKNSVYLLADFNQWTVSENYQLAKDGDYFWLTVNGLTPGKEYAFQYLVDETLQVGDPYADKILDPAEDGAIDEITYPNPTPYPDNEVVEGWVSVMQTDQPSYPWIVNDFVPPAREDLVIYELLVRDFDVAHNYQAVIDRLDYLEDLGVNAIQLMPIMEFNGNLSWGYNPAYFFAPDKYYGTKDALKGFIDACHARGMAVILDMVLNHTHERNPLAALYWDEANKRPAADSPWLNQQATHPFNVFFDFNHESLNTQHYVDTVNHYWLEEYRFDGYRFDLSKGFTQTFTGDNLGAWNAYDQSRVDILTRMVDKIWSHHPEAYVIFEHLSDNQEEKVLADYGIMLWGNMNENFNQLTMGYEESSNIDWAYYATRGWNDPNLISYMESHDEERLVYRNLTLGNTTRGGHNTTNLDIALERVKAASAVYYAIPGPRMLWQFGELGYDISINQNGRTGNKPIPWQTAADGLSYDTDEDRVRLNKVTAEIIRLKTSYSVFSSLDFTLDESQSLVKKIVLKNDPFVESPLTPDDMNVVIVANFNVTTTPTDLTFPHTGNWYHYFAGGELLEVSEATINLNLQPGEFRIYTDVALEETEAELIGYVTPLAPELLSLTEIQAKGVQLQWLDNSAVEVNYKVLRSDNGGAFEEIATLPSNTTSYLDEEAVSLQEYAYKVVSSNSIDAAESNVLTITTTNVITSLVIEQVPGFSIYPNPTQDRLTIDGGAVVYDLSITDLSGKVIHTEGSISGLYQTSVQHLNKGMYLIVIHSKQGINVGRVVKK
ncbi:alpha-amylase family glycosyl hydrolase [Fulvivirga sp. M361]|uniref:alpha-amylase family glycosyl hydrolase n=1 Tax=Fulvivirga sp. M361 TaxID=2594266 RepID=UPI001628657B|nr:alpha-amylase family glycosyl hydrolase [Fulvivirga sp. M361]